MRLVCARRPAVAIPASCHTVSIMRRLSGAMIRDFDPPPGVTIATLAYDYRPNYAVDLHAHGSDQLLFAPRGAMEVSAGRQRWLIPPQFAFWIPARTKHSIRMCGAVSMRTLYLRPGLSARLPGACTVIR